MDVGDLIGQSKNIKKYVNLMCVFKYGCLYHSLPVGGIKLIVMTQVFRSQHQCFWNGINTYYENFQINSLLKISVSILICTGKQLASKDCAVSFVLLSSGWIKEICQAIILLKILPFYIENFHWKTGFDRQISSSLWMMSTVNLTGYWCSCTCWPGVF